MTPEYLQLNEVITRDGYVDLRDPLFSELTVDDVNSFCDNTQGIYKLDELYVVSHSYVKAQVFDLVRKEEAIKTNEISMFGCVLSPHFAEIVLEELQRESKVSPDPSGGTGKYIPKFEKLITVEEIKKHCRHNVSGLSLKKIVERLGFSERLLKENSNGYSVFWDCINQLKNEKFFLSSLDGETLYWNLGQA